VIFRNLGLVEDAHDGDRLPVIVIEDAMLAGAEITDLRPYTRKHRPGLRISEQAIERAFETIHIGFSDFSAEVLETISVYLR